MKCDQFQDWIMLNDAQELNENSQHALNQHLQTCEACRAFASDLQKITQLTRSTPDETKLSDTVRTNILNEAKRALDEGVISKKRNHVLRPIFMYPLAAAAALLLIVTWQIGFINQTPPTLTAQGPTTEQIATWDDEWNLEFAELETEFMLANVADVLFNSSDESYTTEYIAEALLNRKES